MGPKKNKKWNGYSCFMMKRKAQLEMEGVEIKGGLAEVANVVAAEWEALSPAEKHDFKLQADKWNKKNGFGNGNTELKVAVDNRWENGAVDSHIDKIIGASGSRVSATETSSQPQMRYMVQWESLIGNEERNIPLQLPPKNFDLSKELTLQTEKELIMMQDIRASFYAKSSCSPPDETPLPYNKHFLVIHFGNYYTNYLGAHPAEFCITDFSVRDGINNCFSRMLDPGAIPFGFQTEFRSWATLKGYELPGFDPSIEYDNECLDIIQLLMRKYNAREGEVGVLYTIRTEIENVAACLEYVAKKTGRSFRCKIYPLSRLIELLLIEGDHLRGLNKMKPSSTTFAEENAIAMIMREGWNYIPEVACNFHNCPTKVETLSFCSMNLVKRWVYNCLPLLSCLYCCPMFLHNHVPQYDKTGFCYVANSAGYEEKEPIEEKKELWTKAISVESGFKTSADDLQLQNSRSETPRSLHFIGCDSNATGGDESPLPTLHFSGCESNATGGPETSPSSQAIGGVSNASSIVETQHSSTGNIGSVDSILHSDEEKIQKFAFTTHHEFPKLTDSVDACMRAMQVKEVPEMSERQFPSDGGITWTIVNGPSKENLFLSLSDQREATSEENLTKKMTLLSFEEKKTWDFDLSKLKAKYYRGQIDENGMIRFCSSCHSKNRCREEHCFHLKADDTFSDSEDDDEFVGNCNDPTLRRLLTRRVTRHTASLTPGTPRWAKHQKWLEEVKGPSAFVANGEIYSDALQVFKFEGKPISTKFSLNPKQKTKKPLIESIGGSQEFLTSVSQTEPVVLDPKFLNSLEQCKRILQHGALPTTNRPGTNTLFWNTELDGIQKYSGRGSGTLPARRNPAHRGRIADQTTRTPGYVEGVTNSCERQMPIVDEEVREETLGREAPYPPSEPQEHRKPEIMSGTKAIQRSGVTDKGTTCAPTGIGSTTTTKSSSKRVSVGRGRSAALFLQELRSPDIPALSQEETQNGGWTPSKLPQWESDTPRLEDD